MRYISIFSGIEAATVAWEPLGWEPVAFCENDPFPSAVLAHHFPDVPNLGDITKVDWKEVVYERGAVDLVVGGSLCQSFSIAGDRTGLDGASSLMWEFCRCVREVHPRWFVWENVRGALSSKNGDDFRCLLREMDDCGYGLAWRVLDSQFVSVPNGGPLHGQPVPQRRERLFLVGHLGDTRAFEVLLEQGCLRGDTASSRRKREELASRSTGRLGGQGGRGVGGAEPVVIDRAAYNQGVNAKYDPHIERTQVMDTLVARGPHAVMW